MKTVWNGASLDNTATAKLWLLQNRNMYIQDLYQIGPYTSFGAPTPTPGGTTTIPMTATMLSHTDVADLLTGVIDPDSNILYVISTSGVVVALDATTGSILGTVGTFDCIGIVDAGTPAHLYLTQSGGVKLLVMTCGEVWGQKSQVMFVNGAYGSLPSSFIYPVYSGISAGGNNGGQDVDANGNFWICTTDNGGTYGGIPRLIRLTLGHFGTPKQGETILGDATLHELADTINIQVGMIIGGDNLPLGVRTYVAGVGNTDVFMSNPATGSFVEPPGDPEIPDDPSEVPPIYGFAQTWIVAGSIDLTGAPWNFIRGNSGVWIDVASQTMLLSGRDATGNIIMRVDPMNPSTIYASSRTAGNPSAMGQDGTYLSGMVNIYQSSDFSLLSSHSHYDYGISSLFNNGEYYDSVDQFAFEFVAFWPFTNVLDINNPTGTGTVQLEDPTITNPANVGGVVVNPNGGIFATLYNDGSGNSYVDLWAASPASVTRSFTSLGFNWTDADYPIKSTYLNTTYYPQKIQRGSLKYEVGTKPSEYQFTVYTQEAQQPLVPGDTSVRGHPPYQDAAMTLNDSFGGWTLAQTIKQALANGDFDGFPFSIWRAFMPTPGDADTIGVARMFFGYISKLEVTRSYVKITAASIMQNFQAQIPMQIIEPGDRGGSFIPPTTFDNTAQISDPTSYGLAWSQNYIYITSGLTHPYQNYIDGWLLYEYDDIPGDTSPWSPKWNPYYMRRIRTVVPFGVGWLVYFYQPLPMMPWKFGVENDTCYLWMKTSLSNTNSKAPGFPYVPIPETAI